MDQNKQEAGIRSIVVGIDFSEPSRHAFEESVRLARKDNAKLLVAHFIYDEEMAHIVRWKGIEESDLIAGRITHLQRWIEECHAMKMDIDLKVEVGHPFAELMKTLDEADADLLILGAQGEAHANRENRAGSVAQACLRRSPCDLLLVRKNHQNPFKTVVAAIDFSENSKRAVKEAVEFARADNAPLHIIHVFAPAWQHYGERNESREEINSYLTEVHQKFADFTYDELNEIEGLDVTFEIREDLNATHGIVEYSREVSADLIVLGTVGRAPRRISVPGSTAERVVESSPCSVLTVRPTVNFSWL